MLSAILESLRAPLTATVIAVQHMPALFTASFARRLSQSCSVPVREARDGERLPRGHALLAPGGMHLEIRGDRIRLGLDAPVNGHRPSIDVTFASVARRFGPDACAILLTGIGRDGARGIAAVKDAGGLTIAQDEATSVVFGMPKAAILTGKVDYILPDDLIRFEVQRLVRRN